MTPSAAPAPIKRPRTAAERKQRVEKILEILDRTYPGVVTALIHKSAWQLLVATILSAQSTDKLVNQVTPGLFKKYPTIQDFANVNQAELAQDVHSTGFFNNKARSLIGAAKKVLADFGGKVPRTMEEKLTIPGRRAEDRQRRPGLGVRDRERHDRGYSRPAVRAAARSDEEYRPGEDRAGPHEDHPARSLDSVLAPVDPPRPGAVRRRESRAARRARSIRCAIRRTRPPRANYIWSKCVSRAGSTSVAGHPHVQRRQQEDAQQQVGRSARPR